MTALVNKIEKSTNETEKRLGLNGIFVVVALLVLYGISCTVVKSWQIYTDEFFGVIELGIISLVISAIWLFMYWFLDRIQHESIKMTLLTFLLGAVAYLSSKGVLDWIIGKEISVFMENIGLPVFSFFIIFVFIVVKMQSFDELVDSFIYGGFLGTGIAFASCMTEFIHYGSLDGQFVIIELITRISVHAAICSLIGFLIHQSLLGKKVIRLVLSIVLMTLLFSADYEVEQIFLKNVTFAEIKVLPVLVSVAFASALVGIVVLLIHKSLKKSEVARDSLRIPQTRVASIIMLVMTLLFLSYALVIRHDEFRTEKFVSSNGKWTFSLPVGFSCVEETSNDSIFDFDIPTGNVFYKNKNGSINLYLFYDANTEMIKITKPLSLGSENGWDISVAFNSFVAEDSFMNPYMLYQKTYQIKKGDSELLVDVFSDKQQDEEAERAARILIRTLEAKND
ncbi:MAG: hypothetical protein IJ257_00660 [Treponema sp.]|nr:hypothetical protein [Treponema sp.]